MSARIETAREGWGACLPDWIEALVAACDESSQNKVAARLGLSGPTVSQVIRNTYAGDVPRIEARVRDVFLADTVNCPALGVIGSEGCLKWRDRSIQLSSAAPLIVRMFNACKRCPRNQEAISNEQ